MTSSIEIFIPYTEWEFNSALGSYYNEGLYILEEPVLWEIVHKIGVFLNEVLRISSTVLYASPDEEIECW